MRLSRIVCYFLFTLFAVYHLQGSIYPMGSIISQFAILLILLISGIYFAKTLLIKNNKNIFYYAWTLLLLLNIIGFILTADFSNERHPRMFKNILGCLLPFYPFYYFANQDNLNKTDLIRFFLIMLPIGIMQFLFNRNQFMSLSTTLDDQNMVNNLAYFFVGLMPFTFLIRNRIFSMLLMGMIMIFIIQGAKRGAIVSGSVGLLIYFYYQISSVEKNKQIGSYAIVLVMVIILGFVVYETFLSNEFLIRRMISIAEGNTSNRDIIYKNIFGHYYHSKNILNFITGYGFAGSLRIAGAYAHSDWLELLSNFGLIGLGIYVFLFYSSAKCILNNDWKRDKQVLMLAITMIWFLVSLISMWYLSLLYFGHVMSLGYLTGSKHRSLNYDLR